MQPSKMIAFQGKDIFTEKLLNKFAALNILVIILCMKMKGTFVRKFRVTPEQ
jgi:hypothetical protein